MGCRGFTWGPETLGVACETKQLTAKEIHLLTSEPFVPDATVHLLNRCSCIPVICLLLFASTEFSNYRRKHFGKIGAQAAGNPD